MEPVVNQYYMLLNQYYILAKSFKNPWDFLNDRLSNHVTHGPPLDSFRTEAGHQKDQPHNYSSNFGLVQHPKRGEGQGIEF